LSDNQQSSREYETTLGKAASLLARRIVESGDGWGDADGSVAVKVDGDVKADWDDSDDNNGVDS
jgi:hypothetical protein